MRHSLDSGLRHLLDLALESHVGPLQILYVLMLHLVGVDALQHLVVVLEGILIMRVVRVKASSFSVAWE